MTFVFIIQTLSVHERLKVGATQRKAGLQRSTVRIAVSIGSLKRRTGNRIYFVYLTKFTKKSNIDQRRGYGLEANSNSPTLV